MPPPARPPKTWKRGTPEQEGDPGWRELRQIQETFAAALFRPLAPGDRMQAKWIDGRPMEAVTAEIIRPNERLTAFERLEIYNKVYWYRVLDSMYDDFPVVRAVVGSSKFQRVITAYLAECPSASYTLRDLGSRFPVFLEKHPELTGPHSLLSVEAARFEWAQVVAFDGEARTPLALDAALDTNPAELRLGLQPYLSLLELAFPLDDFAIAIHHRDRVQAQTSNVVTEQAARPKIPRVRRPAPERVWIGVHRQENTLYYKRLEPGAFAILAALQQGETLAKACDRGAAACLPETDLATSIQQWFHDWAALGWLCAR